MHDPASLRILVVDDSKVMRRIIQNHLAALGYPNVIETSSGRKALALIEEGSVDLVFSDWVMPGMHGIELLRRVRANPATRELPFVMVTAEAQPHLIYEAIQAKVSYYVVKPFTREMLQKALNRVLHLDLEV